MITTPNAELESLAYELYRWKNSSNYATPPVAYAYSDAVVEAEAIIAALADPWDESWVVSNHPLVKFISDTFGVHWKRASHAIRATLLPPGALLVVSGGVQLQYNGEDIYYED